ncbi:polysaccharide deacetylase family protein [Floricoccus penangensis]|nr:polysaccharide deacetylase family protein [Floricoccus penangensis]
MNKEKILKIMVAVLSIVLIAVLAYRFFYSSNKQTSDNNFFEAKEQQNKDKKEKKKETDKDTWKKYDDEIKFPILMYHHISEVVDGNTLFVPQKEFEEQMKSLHDAGYYTLSPEEAYRVLTKNEKPAEKIVWVTLDDGYVDNMKNAKPILDKLNMKATINIIFNMKDGVDKMTDDMLQEINKDKLISLESHTMDHIDLQYATPDTAKYQLEASKKGLDELLKQDTSVICYPSGRYNDSTPELAKNAGYKLGITTNPGLASASNGLYTLNRVRVAYGNNAQSFMNLIDQGQ